MEDAAEWSATALEPQGTGNRRGSIPPSSSVCMGYKGVVCGGIYGLECVRPNLWLRSIVRFIKKL
jgi:hypothetical protein